MYLCLYVLYECFSNCSIFRVFKVCACKMVLCASAGAGTNVSCGQIGGRSNQQVTHGDSHLCLISSRY